MHAHPAWAFWVILATELWATGHLLGRDAYRGSSRRCDGHWSGNRRGVTLFHSFTRSLTLSTPSATPSDTPTRETFQPIVTASPHTLKPLTSNQPWRPNGVLYGRHWANAACTRVSTPPALPLPSFPSSICPSSNMVNTASASQLPPLIYLDTTDMHMHRHTHLDCAQGFLCALIKAWLIHLWCPSNSSPPESFVMITHNWFLIHRIVNLKKELHGGSISIPFSGLAASSRFDAHGNRR